ncbi:BREX protein BrxB domain-containing protein [Desulfosporosinus metallidurans]|uniref:Putative cytoplasmic protein n=1 Tax=Desulfosporosinus metallidurans TaxID=1888891 RepID=A0A1Q8QSR5_9FIRM|nr:BREX protein BrxB domain-containing protein [Desulfosporosinus metallidurans]OLN30350.1 putative cytoplasmic protein [Desulfosporosinus metallidurans]
MIADTYERLNHVKIRIHEQGFTTPKGIGSEIPHYVFDYPAEDELKVRTYLKVLVEQSPMKIQTINLFEFFLNLFEGDIEDLLEISDEEGLTGLVESTETVLVNEQTLVESFIKAAGDAELILITGVGNAFPLMRSSKLLKILSTYAYRRTIILFYPGQFTGLNLCLFHKLNNEDQYQLSRI